QLGERFLHALQVSMLTATHPLIFRTLQRALICLPGFEDRELFAGRNAPGVDHVHWVFEWRHLTNVRMELHRLLLILAVLPVYMRWPFELAKASFVGLALFFLMGCARTG